MSRNATHHHGAPSPNDDPNEDGMGHLRGVDAVKQRAKLLRELVSQRKKVDVSTVIRSFERKLKRRRPK
jgi:hypothetical protein